MKFDLLVKGGEIVDTAFSGTMDVAVKNGTIAAVDRDIPESAAAQVVGAEGRIVTPGLIDLHTHVFRGLTFWGVDAEAVGSRTGVTTWVDAGSAGAYTLPGFREFIVEPATVRIYAFLNIASIGLIGHNYELANLAFSDPGLFARMFELHADLIVGTKVRMGSPTVGRNGVEPLKRAKEAARTCGLPVMVHIGTAPPTIEEVVSFMEEGDILTHCFTGQDMRILDGDRQLLGAVEEARERGMIFDLGHGSGSFTFAVAEPLMEAGYRPDVISTDIHQMSIDGPMFDLPTTLSKFLALGMSLPEVVQAATVRPAEILGLAGRLGTLQPGAAADIALFDLKQGRFPFYDIDDDVRYGTGLLVNTLTIVNGRPMERLPEVRPAPWMDHDFSQEENFYINSDFQEELRRRGHVPAMMAEAADAPARAQR